MIITFKTFKMNAFNCIFELRLGDYWLPIQMIQLHIYSKFSKALLYNIL